VKALWVSAMRELSMPAAAVGSSTTSCQFTCGRSGGKVVFGVKV
jgi:hypothetical protein